MRTVLSGILLTLLLVYCGGYYFLYQAHHTFHQKSIIQNSSSAETNWLRFSLHQWNNSSSIQKVEHNEFIYKGNFYDIKQKVKKTDSIYLQVIYDEEENHLWETFSSMIGQLFSSDQENPPQSKKNLNVLLQPFLAPVPPTFSMTDKDLQLPNSPHQIPVSQFLTPPTPPPLTS